jgi:hypothetical protein
VYEIIGKIFFLASSSSSSSSIGATTLGGFWYAYIYIFFKQLFYF